MVSQTLFAWVFTISIIIADFNDAIRGEWFFHSIGNFIGANLFCLACFWILYDTYKERGSKKYLDEFRWGA